LLLIYCYFSTENADFPLEATEKWDWVWKVLVFAIFLPLTITTRLRIEALATTLILSASCIIIAAGIKTAASGGGYGVLNLMSDSNTGLYESSTLACVAISLIPFILYLRRNSTIFPPDWRVSLFCGALCFACLLIPVGTEARTGLICIAALGMMMLRAVKRPFLYIFAAAFLGLASLPFLPESFTKRMDTMNEVQADESASTRLAVWRWTLDYVGIHPMGGGFDSYRGNSFRYEARTSSKFDPNAPVVHEPGSTIVIVDEARAFHSAYFEMLGEQGWPGLGIWLFIHLSGLLRMEILLRRYRNRAPEDGHWIAGLATALLLLPFAAVTLFRKSWPPLACAGGALVLGIGLHFWFVSQDAATLGHDIVWNGLPRCIAGFFGGVLMAMAWRARPAAVARHGALAFSLSLFGLWVVGLLPETLAVPLSFTAFVYWLAETSAAPGNPLAGRIAVYLGEISYSTYLAHFLLWIAFKHIFVTDAANVALGLIALYIVAVYLASELLYRLVESPGRVFLQSWGHCRRKPSLR